MLSEIGIRGRRGRRALKAFLDFSSALILLGLVGALHLTSPPAVPAQTTEEITILGKIPTDRIIDQVGLAPGSAVAYGISHLAEALYIFDLETYQVREKVDLGRKPVGLAVDPAGNLAYVIAGSATGSGNNGYLAAVNPQGVILKEQLPAEDLQDLALDTKTGRLLVSAGEGKKLLVYSAGTLEKIKEILLPFSPGCLAPDPDSGRVVVTARETPGSPQPERIAVLDLESGVILLETPLTERAEGLALGREKDLALILSREKILLYDINQGLSIAALAETIPHYKKVITKGSRLRGNEYFGLDINQATGLGVVSGKNGLVLIDLETRSLRPLSAAGMREIRAIAVDRFRNTLLGFYWTEASPVEKGLIEIQLPNPLPELTALAPAEAVRGLADQSIAVEGQGFLFSSEGYLGGRSAPGQFLDNRHWRVFLPEEAVAMAGTLSLSVDNPGPAGGRSNSLDLLVKNPAPSLTGLNPASVQAGASGLVLNVFGTGFWNDSFLFWNGTAKPFSLVGSGRLQVTLSAADLETAADLPVTVANPGPGGGLSNAVTFSIRNPEPALFSLSPQAARAGDPGFTLIITGANLARTATVYFNQVPVAAAYVDGGRLEAQIPAELIQAPGNFPVRLVNPGPGGGSSGAIDFLVSPVALLPVGSFGKKYEDLVPPDAALPQYDPLHFSLITGLVKDRQGKGLPGVEVTVLGRAEYGTARTGADGRYTLPLDGGGTFSLRYRQAGFLEAHRQVEVGWNSFAAAETLVLIPEDPAATTLVFDGNPATAFTHTGSLVSDGSGIRSLTMVFSGDNRAWVRDAQGVEQPRNEVTVRATEYTAPETMPAKLPPNSAFTYCAELSVDGARNVRFEKPVTVFVDNFLGFNVGDVVPVGFYDRDRGLWVPSDNGKVVRLLDTDGDGVVDTYSDGQGQYPAPGLTDTARYVPNGTFWRVEISHFTPWDCNWPYGPAPGAIEPNPSGPPVVTGIDRPCQWTTQINSYVDDQGCVFHEDLPLPGSDFYLHYASDRTPGYKPRITIPASGASVPGSLLRIIVKMELAGRTFEAVLPPLANQQTEFVWDGLDHLGREVTGSTQARIRIGFEYPAVYYAGSSIFEQAFAQPGSTATWVQARENIIAWQETRLNVDRGEADLARGWTLSSHHILNPSDPGTLHKGDGARLRNNLRTIATAARVAPVGDGISILKGMAFDRAGNLFFTDYYNYRYMKMAPDGQITYYRTLETPLGMLQPQGLAVDGAGNLYMTNPDHYYGGFVVKVDPSGGFSIIAGNRQQGFSGDGGPATAASFNWPEDLALDGFGNIYVADTNNNRIRKIDPNGIITTVAGNGQRAFGGDGGPAVQAALAGPRGVTVDSKGNLYIVDTDNHRIRKVDTGGIITTVAGNGLPELAGDGGPAIQAGLTAPRDLALDRAGNIYIADTNNYRIRKVDSSGIITTIAGNGERANDNGEGGPAVQATLHDPYGVAVDSAGNVFAAVLGYGKIKKISFPGAFKSQPLAGDAIFADENGQGYVLDGTGAHRITYDLATGKTLLAFEYDPGGRLRAVTDRFDNRTIIERDGSGLPLSITAPDGLVTHLTVDGNRHLTGVTYPDGGVHRFSYTADGLLIGKTDPLGLSFGNQFDAGGLITGVWDPEGGLWNYARTVDNTGQVSVTQTTAEGTATTFRERTDFSGTYTADKTDSSGAVFSLARSADGLMETEQAACGMAVTRGYGIDPAYRTRYVRETAHTSPLGLLRQLRNFRTYQDTNGDNTLDTITRTVSLNGNNWTSVQNTLAGTIVERSPLGRTATLSYDPANLLIRNITVSGLLPGNYAYDERGRLTGVAVGDRTVTLAYDAAGNIEQITTPDQKVLRYTYDPVGRVLTQTQPGNTLLRYHYDPNGNLTVLTGPNNINFGFDYTGVNLRKTMTHPLSGNYRYSYDRDRRLTSILFPSGRELINTYSNGLLTETTTPEGVTRFSYGCGPFLGGAVRDAEQVSYAYDGGLLTSDTRSGLLNQAIGYLYNNDFRVSSISYAGGTQTLAYDSDGLLTGAGGFTITRKAQNGLPESFGDGILTGTRTFNGYGELNGITYTVAGAMRYSYSLSRDQAGRISGKVETVAGSTDTYEYGYDGNGRLVEVRKNGPVVESYEYDANGNRARETNNYKGLVNQPFTHSSEDHLLTAGNAIYQFDADGFLTGRTAGSAVTNYQYSSRGELLRVELPAGAIVTYDHDPLGRRIAKRVNGAIAEKYLWRDATTLLAVYDGNDQLLSRFTYADNRVPASMTVDTNTYYLLYDQIGSLRVVVDGTGAVVKRIDYDTYGYIISDTNPAFSVPFGFAGGLHDRNTGLIRFGARDYDPAIGRWTAKDPIDFGGGDTNLYGYVGEDPVNWVDPLGLFCGSGITEYFVPDSWWGKFNFSGACKKHDDCYGTCGKEKTECDENFKKDMFKECAKLKGYWSKDCYATASVYFLAVKMLGSLPYQLAQDKLPNVRK